MPGCVKAGGRGRGACVTDRQEAARRGDGHARLQRPKEAEPDAVNFGKGEGQVVSEPVVAEVEELDEVALEAELDQFGVGAVAPGPDEEVAQKHVVGDGARDALGALGAQIEQEPLGQDGLQALDVELLGEEDEVRRGLEQLLLEAQLHGLPHLLQDQRSLARVGEGHGESTRRGEEERIEDVERHLRVCVCMCVHVC